MISHASDRKMMRKSTAIGNYKSANPMLVREQEASSPPLAPSRDGTSAAAFSKGMYPFAYVPTRSLLTSPMCVYVCCRE